MVKRHSAKKNRESKRLSRVRMSNFIGVVVNSKCQGINIGSIRHTPVRESVDRRIRTQILRSRRDKCLSTETARASATIRPPRAHPLQSVSPTQQVGSKVDYDDYDDRQPATLRLAWASLIWMGTIHVGALLAFVPAYFSWSGLALCFLLHWLTGGIGICMTYHRLLTHRSFAVRPH